MPSVQELQNEISVIKDTSLRLSTTVMAAGRGLSDQGNRIAALVRGSRTGMDAVSAVSLAARALSDAAASMTTLGATCDNCVRYLSR